MHLHMWIAEDCLMYEGRQCNLCYCYQLKISPVQGLTVDSSQLTFVPTSKSRDTKTRPNIKNQARSNLDIVQ